LGPPKSILAGNWAVYNGSYKPQSCQKQKDNYSTGCNSIFRILRRLFLIIAAQPQDNLAPNWWLLVWCASLLVASAQPLMSRHRLLSALQYGLDFWLVLRLFVNFQLRKACYPAINFLRQKIRKNATTIEKNAI